jgi:hypothetical protein
VDKYLTTDQTMFKHKICNMQIHQHKQTCRKKCQTIFQYQYLKPPMKRTKKLLSLQEENCISKHHDISIKIYKKLIDMGLGEDLSLEKHLLNLQITEEKHILGLQYTIQKPTLFLNENQMI